jgi:DNA-directed RNA polymerase subunit N (RpoN/RPB10)
MSDFWETYKKRVAEGADRLSAPPKEAPQNILWLKAYVSERMDKEGLKRYVGKSEDGTFGFKEEFVNYLMHYAYEAGKSSNEYSFNQATEGMRKSLDKIKDALDDIGWIDYSEY